MSGYNNTQGYGAQHPSHGSKDSFYPLEDQHHGDFQDVDVGGYQGSNSYPMNQTSQQRRQEERRRHAEAATAAAAAAGQGSSPWLDKQQKKTGRWKTVIGVLAALILIAIAGVLAWYFAVHKKNETSNNKSQTGKGGEGPTGPTGVYNISVQAVVTPNGTVIPNTNYPLKRVFYGMAYVPLNAQLPNCYNTQESVNRELKLLVQTTKRVRLYGTDCKVLEYTLNAIQTLKLDLKVVVGIWIDSTNTTYARQREDFFQVAAKYGWGDIIGVSVGNEVLFDAYQTQDVLIAAIKEVKARMVSLGQASIPVFTSDLERDNKPPLTNNEDKAGVNLHPFFSGVPVEGAAAWFWKYLEQQVKPAVNKENVVPIDVWITEVGWPTFPAHAATNSSVPSIPNLQTFLDTWLCEANAKKLPYYYFEFFDAPWKIWPGSAVEGFWGLLTIDMKLKVKLPDCLSD
ncbi:hypothetical protein BGW38_005861 [Lunasporangiospora selenospora]|uniref:glucan endo-1,3-beta-D-glucosidase n=1 Tax=Lunasporangiospora selenospora TaxID=979761 RepID=A0A9P6G046_9FUNG|nr:hypothetical protein BGW38_005861 [Lunasporangiospora selenospora]